jgi:hypothetical protein
MKKGEAEHQSAKEDHERNKKEQKEKDRNDE